MLQLNFSLNISKESRVKTFISYIHIDGCPEQFKEYRNSSYLIKKDRISADSAFVS